LKWRLPVGVKQAFSEPEEEAASTTDGTLMDEPAREEILVSPDITAIDLKHNPYVEADIGTRGVDAVALQRSQIIDDADADDDARLICSAMDARMPVMPGLTSRTRAHSDSDIYQKLGACTLGADGSAIVPPPGGIYGVRLEPLNLNKIKNNTKSKKIVPDDKDETDAEPKEDKNNTGLSVESSLLPHKDVTTQGLSESEVDRDMVARAMGASACADSGVQNKSDKLKVSTANPSSVERILYRVGNLRQ
jgi:hypothetical protein